MSEDFYHALVPHDDFLAITEPENYTPVPGDWVIALTDVKNSTQAVQRGQYKDVNLVGASAIIALLNLARHLDIPFIFGGDGATVLLPPSLAAPAKPALLAIRELAQSQFGLELRVGLVPIRDVHAAGHEIRVAKFRISTHYEQAMFAGGGLSYAERLLKDPATAQHYSVEESALPPQADFTGLECRWQDIPSQHGETVSLIVHATGTSEVQDRESYRAVLERIAACYGRDEDYQPVTVASLHPSLSGGTLSREAGLRAARGAWGRVRYIVEIWLRNLALRLALRFNFRMGGIHWPDYLDLLTATTDYKKYDDTLRMIIAGTASQRTCLTEYLEAEYQRGTLVYGLHLSDRALLTCLVFERMGRQVHFVDGADGGYALAAAAMKARLRARQPLSSPPSSPLPDT